MFLPACSSSLDFDGLSRDWGKDCAAGASRCDDVASSLAGLRVDLPCKGDGSPSYTCMSDPTDEKTVTLRGTVGTTYQLKLRFRGIVEMATYSPASGTPPLQVGGMSTNLAYNT